MAEVAAVMPARRKRPKGQGCFTGQPPPKRLSTAQVTTPLQVGKLRLRAGGLTASPWNQKGQALPLRYLGGPWWQVPGGKPFQSAPAPHTYLSGRSTQGAGPLQAPLRNSAAQFFFFFNAKETRGLPLSALSQGCRTDAGPVQQRPQSARTVVLHEHQSTTRLASKMEKLRPVL